MSPTSTPVALVPIMVTSGVRMTWISSVAMTAAYCLPPLGAYRLGITDATRQPNGGATCTAGATELGDCGD